MASCPRLDTGVRGFQGRSGRRSQHDFRRIWSQLQALPLAGWPETSRLATRDPQRPARRIKPKTGVNSSPVKAGASLFQLLLGTWSLRQPLSLTVLLTGKRFRKPAWPTGPPRPGFLCQTAADRAGPRAGLLTPALTTALGSVTAKGVIILCEEFRSDAKIKIKQYFSFIFSRLIE